jgi:hypothetical protein
MLLRVLQSGLHRRTSLAVALAVVAGFTATGAAGNSLPRVLSFERLPRGLVAGIPRDARARSRIVGTFSGHRLAVAPTRPGSFCEAFSHAFAGCRARAWAFFNPAVFAKFAARRGAITAVAGDIATANPGTLAIRSGSRQVQVAVAWVSRPIAAGFFFVNLPRGWRTARLVLSRNGRVVAQSEVLRVPALPRHHP